MARLESAPSVGVPIGALCDVCLPEEVHTHVENFGSEALPALSASLEPLREESLRPLSPRASLGRGGRGCAR